MGGGEVDPAPGLPVLGLGSIRESVKDTLCITTEAVDPQPELLEPLHHGGMPGPCCKCDFCNPGSPATVVLFTYLLASQVKLFQT